MSCNGSIKLHSVSSGVFRKKASPLCVSGIISRESEEREKERVSIIGMERGYEYSFKKKVQNTYTAKYGMEITNEKKIHTRRSLGVAPLGAISRFLAVS